MYSSFSFGNTVVWNSAQWEQVIEAYSITVTGASSRPSAFSGSGPGAMTPLTAGPPPEGLPPSFEGT